MYQDLISQASNRHGLPEALIAAIVQVESEGDTFAVRYEPQFVQAYLLGRQWPVFHPKVTQDTEIWQRGASFGLMQIMGQVARERGCNLVFLTELCKPELGLDWGCRQLERQRARFRTFGWEGIVSSYNAGTPASHNKNYVFKVESKIPGGFASLPSA